MRTGPRVSSGMTSHPVIIDRDLHLYMINRGVLMTPFHNMALMCPAITEAHTAVFAAAADDLLG
jgi:glutamate-1-semialdehyde 2,1-aminomutase